MFKYVCWYEVYFVLVIRRVLCWYRLHSSHNEFLSMSKTNDNDLLHICIYQWNYVQKTNFIFINIACSLVNSHKACIDRHYNPFDLVDLVDLFDEWCMFALMQIVNSVKMSTIMVNLVFHISGIKWSNISSLWSRPLEHTSNHCGYQWPLLSSVKLPAFGKSIVPHTTHTHTHEYRANFLLLFDCSMPVGYK